MRVSIAGAIVRRSLRCWTAQAGALASVVVGLLTVAATSDDRALEPPARLEETGLYSDFKSSKIHPHHFAFSPQYPLWTDGASKRRWMSLPRGATIDASDPEAWKFPIGTRFWKEFSFQGRRVETRYLELQPTGEWLYAAYEWSQDGRDARLVPKSGRRGAFPLANGRSHTIPSVVDCQVCHQGKVLGFSALQLSPDRDPGALHVDERPPSSIDLRDLLEKGRLIGAPTSLAEVPPRIAARSPLERAVLGYMHGNCGHCHNREGPLRNLELFLRQSLDTENQSTITTTVGHRVMKLAPGQSPDAALRVAPGRPHQSGVAVRAASRYPPLQMPPLGTELVDEEAVSLLQRWIAELGELDRTEEGKGGNNE